MLWGIWFLPLTLSLLNYFELECNSKIPRYHQGRHVQQESRDAPGLEFLRRNDVLGLTDWSVQRCQYMGCHMMEAFLGSHFLRVALLQNELAPKNF